MFVNDIIDSGRQGSLRQSGQGMTQVHAAKQIAVAGHIMGIVCFKNLQFAAQKLSLNDTYENVLFIKRIFVSLHVEINSNVNP